MADAPSPIPPRPAYAPATPAGYAAPAAIQRSDTPLETLSPLISRVLNDPLLLRQLSDRCYALMKADLRQQRDRRGPDSVLGG